MIRSGDGGATVGGGAAAAPRGRRQRRPGGRGGSGSGASPWWMPHPERCPPSREPWPPPQGGGGNNLRRGDPSLFPRLSAQPSDPRRPGRVRGKEKRGAARADWRAAPPATGVECGGVRQGRSGRAVGRAKKPRAEAALLSGMRRGGSRARLAGGWQEGAEPRLQAASARSYQSPPHHLPPRCRLPAQPPAASGAVLKNQRNRARGLRWRIPPDTLQPGRLQRGKRGRRGACEAVASKPIASTRADEEQPLPGSRVRRSSLRARRTAASPPLASAQQHLRGPAAPRASTSPPHTRPRGVARGAAEALTPPAPSAAAAAARTRGSRRRRRSSPWRLLPASGFPRGQK